jgi:hypothetical protein
MLKEFFVYAYYNETEQLKKSQKITAQDKIRYSLFGRGFSLLSFVKEKKWAYEITCLSVLASYQLFNQLVDFVNFSTEVMPLKVTSKL